MAGGTGANPYVGQIIMVGFTFAPPGWAFCNGQLLSIAENTALFALIGTTYGGDGQTTYALPDLRGRVPIHSGQGQGLSNYVIGEVFGSETVPLTVNELPQHQHLYSPGASQSEPTSDRPDGNYPAAGGYYAGTTNSSTPMPAPTVAPAGGNAQHNNVQPYLGVNFLISLFGIFPARS